MLILVLLSAVAVDTEHISHDIKHVDVRCKCVCPNPSVVNASHTERKLYIKNVPPTMCDCPNVVITSLYETMTLDPAHAVQLPEAFCPRCVCRYEQRNTGVIKFVVITVMIVIGFLVTYQGFLLLEPRWRKRNQLNYREHREEEMSLKAYDSCLLQETDPSATLPDVAAMTPHSGGRFSRENNRPAILSRVNNQQDRWKQQVEIQRRAIYEERTILN